MSTSRGQPNDGMPPTRDTMPLMHVESGAGDAGRWGASVIRMSVFIRGEEMNG